MHAHWRSALIDVLLEEWNHGATAECRENRELLSRNSNPP